jgi:hypothetical protein
MLCRSLTAAGVALACASAFAQSTDSYTPGFVRTKRAPPAIPPITLPTPPLVGGSDSCSTADVITGGGPFAFDFTNATTGAEGQTSFLGGDCNVGCAEYGNANVAVPTDVWFTWTAPTSGTIDVSTCGGTADTKLAVYDGTVGCPTGTTCLGCSDDYHFAYGMLVDSRVITPVTAGQNIKIQIGASTFGAAGTIGNFSISYLTFDQIKDDGSSENAYSYGAAGAAMFEIATFGAPAATTTVTGVRVAWGLLNTAAATDGTPSQVAIWSDPTNDGNPNDAVLIQTQATTVQMANTDTFVTVPLNPAVTVNGVYFVGVIQNHLSTADFPFAFDGNGCLAQPNTAWIGFNSTGTADLMTLTNNTQAPVPINIFCQAPTAYNGQFHGEWLLRPATQAGPVVLGTPFCIGDSVGPHTACPCGNSSATVDQVGCLNSLSTGGKLRATGVASLGGDTALLQGSQMPNSSALYFQGTIQQNSGNGSLFGDGLRCAGGAVIRLGTTTNVSGSSTYPFGAAQPIHIKGAITSPGVRTYQCWYRNAASFCTPSTFNLSNGLEITWTP